MCVGVWKESLILRLGPADKAALKKPPVRAFDITGRPMSGWVLVEPSGFSREENLRRWIELAIEYVATLPAKTSAPKKRSKPRDKTPRVKTRGVKRT
jgi:hypothetical protein